MQVSQEEFDNLSSIDWIRSIGAKPQWFGLGFIQIKLDAKRRMHFWHPDLMADTSEEELHDHRYDFHSTIVAGGLTHEEWNFVPDPSGDHELAEVSCKPGTSTEPKVLERGNVKAGNTYNMCAGSSYSFKKECFHRIRASKAVTFLQRGEVAKDYARILRPIGQPSVCPFSRQIPEPKLWDYMADLLSDSVDEPVKVKNPGYHLFEFTKGEVGEPSKILEEAMEFQDAMMQGSDIMGLVELSDLYGAMQMYLKKHHPSISVEDLNTFSGITQRAFKNGHR